MAQFDEELRSTFEVKRAQVQSGLRMTMQVGVGYARGNWTGPYLECLSEVASRCTVGKSKS
jgi:hypothetical protein